jgi:hypothetical protein
MGIKKLFTFLDNNKLYKKYPYLNDLINDNNIDKKKLLVGVDGNLFCYKYTHSYNNMLIGFFNQILKFLSNQIIPIYIFDGGTLQEKEFTNALRLKKKIISKYKLEQLEKDLEQLENNIENNIENNNERNKDELLLIKKKLEKNSIKINNENIIILLELFDLLNIPYIFSHGEGDYLAVLLNKYNIIDFFLTDDTDPIPAGINKTIKFYNNNVYYLETKLIYEKFNLTIKQFCDLCILFGSDYGNFNHGLKPNELYELILKYKSIEEIIQNDKINCLNEESLILINKIRNIYYNSDNLEKKMFLSNKNIFDYNNINYIDPNHKSSINLIIDHSNISYYSNIMLEYWDEYIEIISIELKPKNSNLIIKKSDIFKFSIYSHISKLKFNIKNIIKFIKNNINDITKNEIDNMILSFEFLNTFDR